MALPLHQRRALLGIVGMPVIDGGYSTFHVIEKLAHHEARFFMQVFPTALRVLRAVEKRSDFGSEAAAHCEVPASSWSAGQAVRAQAELP